MLTHTTHQGYPSLLNYRTAPNVLLWSAATASCAQPGLYAPVPLHAKDVDGSIVMLHGEHLGESWSSRTVHHPQLPMQRLREAFNVNHLIVSQVRECLQGLVAALDTWTSTRTHLHTYSHAHAHSCTCTCTHKLMNTHPPWLAFTQPHLPMPGTSSAGESACAAVSSLAALFLARAPSPSRPRPRRRGNCTPPQAVCPVCRCFQVRMEMKAVLSACVCLCVCGGGRTRVRSKKMRDRGLGRGRSVCVCARVWWWGS